MDRIKNIRKQTDNRYLNLYELEAKNRVGGDLRYYIASRTQQAENLKLNTHNQVPDGVIIYSLYGEKRDRVVLVRQYRYSIDDYIYEFPAGLVDEGESLADAGVREMKEETGLEFSPIPVNSMYRNAFFTTIGMTDECCGTVYGYAHGTVSAEGLEDTEDIEVVLADRNEVRRILREERVAIMCAYMLMHFLKDEDPFAFLGMFEIRPMCEQDLDEVAALEREIFSVPWSKNGFASALRQEAAHYLTVRLDGELAGYCGFLQSFDEADITNVAVAPAFRGQKIAQCMLEELMRQGRKRGVASYTLEVRASNAPAIHLYKKLGFVDAGIRPGFYDDPKEDALILWK